MVTPRAIRPVLCGAHPFAPHHHHQRRTFLPNPFNSSLNPLASDSTSTSSTPQTLSATRTLPYPSHPIYSIISDVSSYSTFLPYCQSSSVTRWSAPDHTYHRRWPSEAHLQIGWGHLTESFTSRVFCVPGRIVESIGGDTATQLPKADIAHHLEGSEDADKGAKGAAEGLLTHLRSRWTIEELGREKTQVTLALEFLFANPLYTTLSAGAAPKVAEVMIKAFEERATSLLEGNPQMARATLGELDGSRPKR